MSTRTIDRMARQTATMSRRGSLRVMGMAALAGAMATDEPARAGKAKNTAQKRCKRQQGQCAEVVKVLCEDPKAFNTCEAIFLPCCKHFASCDARKGLECLIAGDGEEMVGLSAPTSRPSRHPRP